MKSLADLAVVDAPPGIPTLDDPESSALSADSRPGTASVRETVSRMAETVRTGRVPSSKASNADIMSAFDSGGSARLAWDEEPGFSAPKNPVPSGSRTRKGTGGTRTVRPAGASDLQPLFATGILLLATFLLDRELAPTEPEANAIAAPLANVLARRIDLAAKLGQDASDTVALAVALMAYGARVAPVAMERSRDAYERYQRRQRVDRVGRPPQPSDDRAADGVDSRSHDGAGAGSSPLADPAAALAKARGVGWGAVVRDLGGPSNGGDPVGSNG